MSRFPFDRLALAAACLFCLPVHAADEPTPIEPEKVELGRPVDFGREIAPVLEANCVACHNVAIDEGKLSLETLPAMLKGGKHGPAVVPGKPDESPLFALAARRKAPAMPPPDNDVEAKPLTPHQLGLLRQWIAEGAGGATGAPDAVIEWRPLPPHLKSIHAVALSPDARFAAVGAADRIATFDLATDGGPVPLVDPELAALAGGAFAGAAHRDLVESLAFGPDGRLLASGGFRAVKLWRRTGLAVAPPLPLTGPSAALAVSADGRTAAAAVGREVLLVRPGDGQVTDRRAADADVRQVAVSGDAGIVAAVTDGPSLVVWKDDAGPATVALPAPPTDLAVIGGRIVTAFEDGLVRTWSGAADAPLQEFTDHPGRVNALAAVPGRDDQLVTAGEDGSIRIADLADGGKAVRTIGAGGPVAAVAVTLDGATVVAGGRDGVVRFFAAADGRKVGEFAGSIAARRAEATAAREAEWRKQAAAVAASRLKEAEDSLKDRQGMAEKARQAKAEAETKVPEAKTKADDAAKKADEAKAKSGEKPDDADLKKQADESAAAAEAAKKEATQADDAVRSAERGVALADDAVKAAVAALTGRRAVKEQADQAATAADAALAAAKEAAAKRSPVVSVAAGPVAAAAFEDGTVQTFAADGDPLDSIVAPASAVRRIAFAADGHGLVRTAAGEIAPADFRGRWELAAVLGPPADRPLDLASSSLQGRVLAVAFSPDGATVAVGGGEPSRSGQLTVWDVGSRTMKYEVPDAHSDTVQAVAFSTDGSLLASAGADKFAKTFDAATGAPRKVFEGHTEHVLGVGVRADGTELVTAGGDGVLKVWDIESAEQKRTVTGTAKPVTAVRFVGLTDQFVSSGGDHAVRQHRTSDGGQARSYAGPTDYVQAVDVSRDGSTVAVGGEEGTLYLWDAKDGRLLRKAELPATPSDATAAK